MLVRIVLEPFGMEPNRRRPCQFISEARCAWKTASPLIHLAGNPNRLGKISSWRQCLPHSCGFWLSFSRTPLQPHPGI